MVKNLEHGPRRPKLICFDLDWTMWPFHVDTNVSPPLRMCDDGKIRDRSEDVFTPFPGVPEMIQGLFDKEQKMALISRTDTPNIARKMLQLLDWSKYFPYQEIYPGKKTTHFAKISKESGIAYEDMLFFDDEYRNIRDLSAVGVTCLFVKEPMSPELLQKGLDKFAAGKTDR